MIVAFHQPNFLPNIGFFYKMAQADVFVVITNVQFEKGEGWQRRHKIKTVHGDQWVTVPVLGSQHQLIRDVRINQTFDWRRKHTKAFGLTYSRTMEQELLSRLLAIYYSADWIRLVDLNMAFIILLREALSITTPLILDEDVGGRREELTVNLCKKYGADTYLSGVGGRGYITDGYTAALQRNGIMCRYVSRDMSTLYPYSTIHYLLAEGRDKVTPLLCD